MRNYVLRMAATIAVMVLLAGLFALTFVLQGCAQPVETEIVEVKAPNDPPAVTLSAPAQLDNGESATLTAIVTDSDDTAHYYEWHVDGSISGYAPSIGFSRSPQAERGYSVSVMVSDGKDSASATAEIVVAEPPWTPEALHVYTFSAELTEFSDEAIRDEYVFTEADYDEMVDRVRATVESHNTNNPDDQLQIVEGGKA